MKKPEHMGLWPRGGLGELGGLENGRNSGLDGMLSSVQTPSWTRTGHSKSRVWRFKFTAVDRKVQLRFKIPRNYFIWQLVNENT